MVYVLRESVTVPLCGARYEMLQGILCCINAVSVRREGKCGLMRSGVSYDEGGYMNQSRGEGISQLHFLLSVEEMYFLIFGFFLRGRAR